MYELMGTSTSQSTYVPTGIMPRGGRAFYVHEVNGSDSNEGTDPQYPLKYIGAAYDLVADAGGDYVFCQYMSTLQETLTITYNDIHFIALSHGGFDTGSDLNGGSSVSVALNTGGYDIEIAGFDIGNDGSEDAIQTNSTAYRSHIHHCSFGACFTVDYAIHCTSMAHMTIDNNRFDILCTEGGIWCTDMTSCVIANNIFHMQVDATKGIYLPTGASNNSIICNIFGALQSNDEADGWAIDLPSGSVRNVIAGNWASECGDGSGEDPFRDRSSGAAATKNNAWSANVWGNDWSDPLATA